jgi:hypothetical protein
MFADWDRLSIEMILPVKGYRFVASGLERGQEEMNVTSEQNKRARMKRAIDFFTL